MRWKFLFVFYLKQMFKSKLYAGASILFFVLLIARLILFFSDPYDMEAYGQLPHEVLMLVQMVSIFYIVFFYLLHSKELLYGVQSFFTDGYRIMLEKMSAMFAVHVLCQGIMVMIAYGIFSLVYFIVGIEPSDFYLSLLRFLAVYMFGPLVLSIMYGLMVAMFFGTKKISFFVILVVWIVTGSMTTELFIDFFQKVHANDWKSLLFIGKHAVQHVYNSYIGFEVDRGNELKLLTWFLVLFGMILMLSLRWTLTTRERNVVMKVLLMLPFLIVLTAYSSLQSNTKAFTRADQTTEINDYRKMNRDVKTDLRYDIQSYSISLKEKQATVHVKFSRMDTMKPTFQLYHAYPIKWIQANHKRIKFAREGDIVTVYLPEGTTSLTFRYDIVDTSFIPYTNGRTVLLADKAWYPKKRASQMYKIYEFTIYGTKERIWWDEFTDQFLPREKHAFTLKVDGDVLFCNLPKRGSVYSGEAQAVTLIKGQGHRFVYKGYQIIYPVDWPKMDERVSTVVPQLEEAFQDVRQLAPTTVSSLPKTIVFSSFGLSSFMANDHLVYNTNNSYAIDKYHLEQDFYEKMLRLSVQPKGSFVMYNEWIHAAAQFLMEKRDLRKIDMFRSHQSDVLPKSKQELIKSIYFAFQQLSLEQKQQFLRKWYQEMDETWTWDQVSQLVKESGAIGYLH
ncbi:ABC transporter permease [Parageobacillus galactosidasius]|uniref:ABC transporter permease n=1 Tax=Parageobacillus galactosidasius TaxID=883812 RepID=A0A226QMJ3_9BACL|nr:ABC transporter permease [Parageobacillus galactosidasius]OXB93741.1 ABC transporter permease [Parageobacillus galactosidasius]